jgi:DNA-binding NarL/FixJ family response regulator
LPLITPGQRRVLAGILNGKSAAAIAADLALSVHTVNNHTRQIFLTLGVHSRARVILCCLASGVTAETLGLEG